MTVGAHGTADYFRCGLVPGILTATHLFVHVIKKILPAHSGQNWFSPLGASAALNGIARQANRAEVDDPF